MHEGCGDLRSSPVSAITSHGTGAAHSVFQMKRKGLQEMLISQPALGIFYKSLLKNSSLKDISYPRCEPQV